MWNWVQELLDYRTNERERARQHELDMHVCNSCEVMKNELARAHDRERQLLAVLTPKTQEPEQPFRTSVDVSNMIRKKPWSVRRQELERQFAKGNKPVVTVDNLDEQLEDLRDAK